MDGDDGRKVIRWMEMMEEKLWYLKIDRDFCPRLDPN